MTRWRHGLICAGAAVVLAAACGDSSEIPTAERVERTESDEDLHDDQAQPTATAAPTDPGGTTSPPPQTTTPAAPGSLANWDLNTCSDVMAAVLSDTLDLTIRPKQLETGDGAPAACDYEADYGSARLKVIVNSGSFFSGWEEAHADLLNGILCDPDFEVCAETLSATFGVRQRYALDQSKGSCTLYSADPSGAETVQGVSVSISPGGAEEAAATQAMCIAVHHAVDQLRRPVGPSTSAGPTESSATEPATSFDLLLSLLERLNTEGLDAVRSSFPPDLTPFEVAGLEQTPWQLNESSCVDNTCIAVNGVDEPWEFSINSSGDVVSISYAGG